LRRESGRRAAKPSKWGKFSLKSADSAREKSKKWKNFSLLLWQELSSKTLPEKTTFFASNAHIRPIMEGVRC
jgi:hypothetical protein